MKVAHVGATGNIGSKIVAELVKRGHYVTAISRHPERTPAHPRIHAVQGDVDQPAALAERIRGHDVVLSSAPFIPGISVKLLDAVHRSGVRRYIVVGGAGSLKTPDGKLVKENPAIPAEWMPAINEGSEMLRLLQADTELDWTFFSPAVFIGPGERTGKFRLGGDEVVADASGKSAISYDDYAIAFVDEVEQNRHVRRRFTIGY